MNDEFSRKQLQEVMQRYDALPKRLRIFVQEFPYRLCNKHFMNNQIPSVRRAVERGVRINEVLEEGN